MKLLIVYATTEGQTRRIARRLADRFVDAGHAVELLPAGDAHGIEPRRFDGAILAASVHASGYQRDMVRFVETSAAGLARLPTAFLSVSLSAAGHDAEDWRALDAIFRDFAEAVDWTPDRLIHVAGAYMPSRYDILRGFVMRRIIATKDPQADPGADKEYTDWDALFAEIDTWTSGIARGDA